MDIPYQPVPVQRRPWNRLLLPVCLCTSWFCVASAKALAEWGQMKHGRGEQGQAALQEARSVGYSILSFFLSKQVMIWKKQRGCSPSHRSTCCKALMQNASEVSLSEATWKDLTCLHRKLCVGWDSHITAEKLRPIEPESNKELQGQRIREAARPAQVYLGKSICFRKRNTACLPGPYKGNPKLTHRLARNSLR